jgi:hypothetical protein
MRVRLDLATLDDAAACCQATPPVARLVALPPQALIPSPGTAPAPVLTDDIARGGSPRPDGWGESAR